MIAENKKNLTVTEASKELSVSTPTILRQIELGKLRARNVSVTSKPCYRIPVDAWNDFCKAIEVQPKKEK